MKLKVCGMKLPENMQQVASLQPDYLGFIFYEKSKRNFEGVIPELSKSIKKTGVFVNEAIDIVVSLIAEYDLQAIQLHGDETPEYIINLKEELQKTKFNLNTHQKNLNHVQVEVIKVFGIKETFDFEVLKPYLNLVDYFLFDTKGKERGGNGTQFNWSVLENYPFDTPYFLSGGIGLEDADTILSFLDNPESKYCFGLDVNSKFESEPGVKKVKELKEFIKIVFN